MVFLWSYKCSKGLSGGAYLANWVCVWSQRRHGGLSTGATWCIGVLGMSDKSLQSYACTICLSGGGGRLRDTLVV